jgi:tetratricopeptide (TPR) repeat protein
MRARLHSNLGMLHLDRYERSDESRDLDRAIELAGIALEAASPADPERPGFCNNLANALRTRFELQFGRKGEPPPHEDIDLNDLQLAINLYRLAVSQPGPDEGDRAVFLSNLGDALLDRSAMYELEGDLEAADATLGEALSVHAEAVAATPPAAPDRPGRLNKLAVAQRARADRTSAQADVDAARASFREACEAGLLAAPEMALAAAVNWVSWEVEKLAWPQVAIGDGYALRAAEALHRSQALRRHRETWLMASRGLAADAAYAVVRTSDLRGAVARMERARAVLLADSLDVVPAALARLPDADLTRRYAVAAEEVRRLLAA